MSSMQHLFSGDGMFALERLSALPSVLTFDLDGTLAPLTPHFADATVPQRTRRQLMALSRTWPVAIVTGRTVADAQQMLGFTPDYLFGNHGAERSGACTRSFKCVQKNVGNQLDACRQLLQRHAAALSKANVGIEDKGLSLALHYRQCKKPQQTCQWLHELLAPVPIGVMLTDGHKVVNILLAGEQDKGDALLVTMKECGAITALMVGDDENDEAAFCKAPTHAVTVRISHQPVPSKARFMLRAQPEMDTLLAILLQLQDGSLPQQSPRH